MGEELHMSNNENFYTNDKLNSQSKWEQFTKCLFQIWCENKGWGKQVVPVNGTGGDGGVESYCVVSENKIIGLQSKFFQNSFESVQVKQVQKSLDTALKNRPNMWQYIVAIPFDLTNKTGNKQNSGYTKWEQLVNDNKNKHPDCELVLWDKTIILTLCSSIANNAFNSFWLQGKDVINEKILKTAFEQAKNVDEKDKYIPDVAVPGKVRKALDAFLKTDEFIKNINECKERYISLLKQPFYELNHQIFKATSSQKELSIESELRSPEFDNERKKLLSCLQQGTIADSANLWIKNIENFQVYLRGLKNQLMELKNNEYERCEEQLYSLRGIELTNFLKDYCDDKTVMIVQAPPGYGKTFDCLDFVENESVPQSLFVASSYFSSDCRIFEACLKSMGKSLLIDEDVFFGSLYNYTLIVNNNYGCARNNFAIFIDGIDEIKGTSFWNRIICEAEERSNTYPWLKFVFTTRTIQINDNTKLLIKKYKSNSSAPMEELKKRYFNFYGINPNSLCPSQERLLDTPFTLKLFCLLYQEHNISLTPTSAYTIIQLLEKQINSIQEEISKQYGDISRRILKNILNEFSNAFFEKQYVSEDELFEQYYDSNIVLAILNVLKQHQMIYSISIGRDSWSGESKLEYRFSHRIYVDYQIANSIYDHYKTKYLSPNELEPQIFNFYALLCFEKDDVFVINSISDSKSTKSKLDAALYIALNSVKSEKSKTVYDFIYETTCQNPMHFWDVFERLIVPSAKSKHIYGKQLMIDIFSSFQYPIERDCFLANGLWNSETIMSTICKNKWNADLKGDLPYICAWLLCSLDSNLSFSMRNLLSAWAINNPPEFSVLFETLSSTNDPQMLVGLYGIVMNVIQSPSTSLQTIEQLTDTAIKTRTHFPYLSIRYYIHEIMHVANIRKINIKRKYNPHNYSMPDPSSDAKGASQGGYKYYISYDEDRYILTDPLYSAFSGRPISNDGPLSKSNNISDYEKEIKLYSSICNERVLCKVLTDLGRTAGLETLFEVSLGLLDKCFEYFGWKLSETPEIIEKIQYMFESDAATHGARSERMKLSEKYVWIVRDILFAYYLDKAWEISEANSSEFDLFNLSLLCTFGNPYQDYLIGKEKQKERINGFEELFTYKEEDQYIKHANTSAFNYPSSKRTKALFDFFSNLNLFPIYGNNRDSDTDIGFVHELTLRSLIVDKEDVEGIIECIKKRNVNFFECADYSDFNNCGPLDFLKSNNVPTLYESVGCFSLTSGKKTKYISAYLTSTQYTHVFEAASFNNAYEEELYVPSKFLLSNLKIDNWDGMNFYKSKQEIIKSVSSNHGTFFCLTKDALKTIEQHNRTVLYLFLTVDYASYELTQISGYDNTHYRIIAKWVAYQNNGKLTIRKVSEKFD